MESEFFEEWFRKIFLRDIEKLKKNVLIVMDNARFHRKRILEKIIKETRYCLLFLPPYSSDLNLIKKVMTSLKKKLKDIAHNFNTLLNKLYYIITNIKQKRWEEIEDQETLGNRNLSLDIGCNILNFIKKIYIYNYLS